MEVVRDPNVFQRMTREWRTNGLESALIPTMGALHVGHYRLIEEGRRRAARTSVSIFVNPKQFGPTEDLANYPRTFEADCEGCRARGVDVVFAPTAESMYPAGFLTRVNVEKMSEPLCGLWRPGHFEGVTTVVLKLLLLAQPTLAVFGWKDAQQFLILRRMVRDLALPVEMIGVETVRESDGLAASSRNRYLSAEERGEAALIYRGLSAAREAFASGERSAPALEERAKEIIRQSTRMEIQYVEARSMDSLERTERVKPVDTLLAAAVMLGQTRLIDNVRF